MPKKIKSSKTTVKHVAAIKKCNPAAHFFIDVAEDNRMARSDDCR